MTKKDRYSQDLPLTLEDEVQRDLEPLGSFELPPDLESRVVSKSLESNTTANKQRWRWLVASVCLSPLALVVYLASGTATGTSPEPTAPPLPEGETESYVLRNDGNLILLEQGDQVVALIGAEP